MNCNYLIYKLNYIIKILTTGMKFANDATILNNFELIQTQDN